jgi:hypothetical protein
MPDRTVIGRSVLRGVAFCAAVVGAAVLAGCAVSSTSTTGAGSNGRGLGQPIATATSTSSAKAPSSAAETRAATTGAMPPDADDDVRLPTSPPGSKRRSRAILTVAIRFAEGYLAYQIGHEDESVRKIIHATCTRAFARLLLSEPVSIPAALRGGAFARPAAITRVVYTGRAALGPGPPTQIVIARYRTEGRASVSGELTVQLRSVGTQWRVAGLG